MKVVLLRVGIDAGVGGIQGPLFKDGSFEFIPMPDYEGVETRTYGGLHDRRGRALVTYFPTSRQPIMTDVPVHVDPEFETFTYGDPTRPKAGLRRLERGDMLAFYAGLQGWDFESEPHLYLVGYFEVQAAGLAPEFSPSKLAEQFQANFHVRNPTLFRDQRDRLVLVKGTERSRLLTRAVGISAYGKDRAGRRIKLLSPEMQKVFGDFGGKVGIQRSPPRWVAPEYAHRAASFLRGLS